MADVLIVTWDGAGNLVPTLGIAGALVERGHGVTVLGHETIAGLFRAVGADFVPLSQRAGWDAVEDPTDFQAEIRLMTSELWFGSGITADLERQLRSAPVDVVLVDCLLFSATEASLASGIPTVALFHLPYTVLRGGPLIDLLEPGRVLANARRGEFGLPAWERLSDIHDACSAAIVAVPREFESDIPDAANVVRVGPVLDAPPLSLDLDAVPELDDSRPLVLVSLSTSNQGQGVLLTRCVDAVAQLPVRAIVTTGPSIDPESVAAGENTEVVRYVPHAEILPAASLVITHAGLGTTLAALGRGVPLVCVPMGRDQFFNAGQVQALGAGLMLDADTSVAAIAAAARQVLGDKAFAARARHLANVFEAYPGAAGAVAALESVASGTRAQ